MSSYESDPLLPKHQSTPEIHGSRAASINDIGVSGAGESDEVQEKPNPLRQRTVGRFLVNCIFGFLLCVFVLFALNPFAVSDPANGGNPPWRPTTIEERVHKVLTEHPLIDGHNDLAILIRFLYNNHIYAENFTKPFEEGGMYAHVDLPRLKEGKVGGAFWAAFVPCPANGSDYSDENYIDSVAFTHTQIDLLTRLRHAYPGTFSPPPDSATAASFFKLGQLISPLAIEGLHQIGNSYTNLRAYHSLGVRYATLTHNCHNIYADAALVEVPGGIEIAKPLHHGISPAGADLVAEMNRLGMIVDLSHVSYDTMKDVLGGSTKEKNYTGSLAPPIFSHSSAKSVCPHPRNVPDDILQLVKKRNSVVMVNFSSDFVSCETDEDSPTGTKFIEETNNLEHVVDHIMHIANLIGFDHVGLGSDFDGIPNTPRGLDDVSKFPDLVAEVLRRGASDEDARKLVGGNVLRVWADVDRVADELRKKGKAPMEDKLPGLKFGE